MRDFEISEAQSRLAYGRVTWIVRMIKNWRMRKDLKRLQGFSDYQLRDIGLTRADLHRLVCLPLDTDMVWHVERHEVLQAQIQPQNIEILALSPAERAASPHLERAYFP